MRIEINIVMVEPEIPQNTGNVARTCAATGARLHLVGPMGFNIDDKKLKRAGLDYWQYLDITYYKNIDELLPYINNARTHDEMQINQIASLIRRLKGIRGVIDVHRGNS